MSKKTKVFMLILIGAIIVYFLLKNHLEISIAFGGGLVWGFVFGYEAGRLDQVKKGN